MLRFLAILCFLTQSVYSRSEAKVLTVPHYNQRDNLYEPGSTCGNTSGSMLISYHLGKKVSPDMLYQTFGKSRGQTPEGLAQIYKAYGLYAKGTRTGSRAEIKNHLLAGRPVVVHGYFTNNGHIITIIGFTDTGWIVNDPAGEWKRCAYCGYYPDTAGKGLAYSYRQVSNTVLSYDGDIWYSVASTNPF